MDKQRKVSIYLIQICICWLISMVSIIPGYGQAIEEDSMTTEIIHTFSEDNVEVKLPELVISGINNTGEVTLDSVFSGIEKLEILVDGVTHITEVVDNKAEFIFKPFWNTRKIKVQVGGYYQEKPIHPFPLWLSFLPPLLAIFLALFFREVIVSLFSGVFIGSFLIAYFVEGSFLGALVNGFLRVIDHYILESLNNPDHLSIIIFSLMIGGMVAIISKNGGMLGIVKMISKVAKNARSGQFATWLMGIAIFFDDYANTLVVGNTMRSITDRLRISREKLSYIVDSTAAPVSALAFITTWIGAELGYIEDGISKLVGFPESISAYSVFLSSLQYSYYPILTLIFILLLIYLQRDFGPMFHAEERARKTGKVTNPNAKTGESDQREIESLSPEEGVKVRAINALLPVFTLIGVTIVGLLFTGWSSEIWADPNLGFLRKLSAIIGASNSYAALMWASLSAVGVAMMLTIGQTDHECRRSRRSLNARDQSHDDRDDYPDPGLVARDGDRRDAYR